MTLADTAHGSDWILWVVFAVFVILTIALLSGHGSKFISGYNTASKEEKARYDEKKLCRVYGIGMGVIAILLLITGLFERNRLRHQQSRISLRTADHDQIRTSGP